MYDSIGKKRLRLGIKIYIVRKSVGGYCLMFHIHREEI